mgnify:CR=1 FL=1
MPSRLPRLALTLPPDLEKALIEYAEVCQKPVATATVQILMEMRPQLEGLTKIARALEAGNKAGAKRVAAHMFGDAFAEMAASRQGDMFPKKRKARG